MPYKLDSFGGQTSFSQGLRNKTQPNMIASDQKNRPTGKALLVGAVIFLILTTAVVAVFCLFDRVISSQEEREKMKTDIEKLKELIGQDLLSNDGNSRREIRLITRDLDKNTDERVWDQHAKETDRKLVEKIRSKRKKREHIPTNRRFVSLQSKTGFYLEIQPSGKVNGHKNKTNYKVLRRVKRSNKCGKDPDYCCKKYEKCSHSQPEMIHLTPNQKKGDFYPKGLVQIWEIQNKTGSIDYRNGEVEVNVDGFYLVYAQMGLLAMENNITDSLMFMIKVNGNEMARAAIIMRDTSTSLTRVIQIRRGDHVSVYVDIGDGEKNITWIKYPSMTFFGLNLMQPYSF